MDDDPTYPLVLSRAFQLCELGDTLVCCSNLDEARDLLLSSADFGLILLDRHLGPNSGIELIPWLREQELWIPVLVHSWTDERAVVEESYRAGGAGFVAKPQGLAELKKLVQSLKGFWLDKNCRP